MAVVTRAEQSRAAEPDATGFAERDGVRLHYEVYGSGGRTVLLLPTWSIVHSRHWKMQIPYLARHCRVLTFDGRGKGRSDRSAEGYGARDFAADAPERVALVLGTEGEGLTAEALAAADVAVQIPMRHGIDSLNVAAASAVAMWAVSG